MRFLNAFGGSEGNKVLIVLGAVHGNEGAGVLAWKRFMKVQRRSKFYLNGLVVAFIGNNEAYKKKVRFIDEDMNRLWNSKKVGALNDKKIKNTEEKAVSQLLRYVQMYLISREMEIGTRTQCILLDIHTTSAESAPFCAITSDFNSTFWTDALGVPVIHGLEKNLGSNSTISFFNSKNFVTKTDAILLEVGQHSSAQAVDFAYQSIIKTLRVFDMIDDETAQFFLSSGENMQATHSITDSELPASMQVVYRHALKQGDIFEMQPNFKSFDRVTTQTLLAQQNGRPIYAPLDAYLLMPLYQKQGDDGFFLVK